MPKSQTLNFRKYAQNKLGRRGHNRNQILKIMFKFQQRFNLLYTNAFRKAWIHLSLYSTLLIDISVKHLITGISFSTIRAFIKTKTKNMSFNFQKKIFFNTQNKVGVCCQPISKVKWVLSYLSLPKHNERSWIFLKDSWSIDNQKCQDLIFLTIKPVMWWATFL